MKCVNCEKAEAAAGWDSLAFQRSKTWSSISEWATGYEKAGLCPDCRRKLAHKHPTMLFPREHRIVFWPANILGVAGAVLLMLEFFFGTKVCTFVGAALLIGSLALSLVMREGDDGENTAIGFGILVGIVGVLAAFGVLFDSSSRSEISTTGWVGLILIAAAAVWYWLGWLLLRAHAADTASPRDALLLGKVEGDERRYVPLGADLYGSKKEFLRVNSLLGKNEKQVYDEFIATGKWKELVADPGAFRFLSFH